MSFGRNGKSEECFHKEKTIMKRSKRIEALDRRPVNLDGYIDEWPEMGFVAMSSPYDPKPSVRVEGGEDRRARREAA